MSSNAVGKLDEMYDLSAIEGQHKRVIGFAQEYVDTLTKASKDIKKLEMSITPQLNIGMLKEMQEEASRITKETAANTKKLADSYLVAAKAQKEKTNTTLAETKALILLQREKERLDKQQAREEAKLKKLNNEYEIAKKRYKDLADEAKRLYFAEGELSKNYIKHRDAAQALHMELLKVEKSVGQAQRQVGNYNVVGEHFNQILRELPNAGLGMRTFLVAISNNISQLVESVNAAIKNGESLKSVFSTMGKQLIGVTGIINALVLVMTYMASNMKSNAAEAKTLTEQMDDLTDSLAKFIQESRKGSQFINVALSAQAANQKRVVDLLKAQGASEEEILNASKKYHQLRQKDISQEIGLYGQARQMVTQYASEYIRADNEFVNTKENLIKFMKQELNMSDEVIKANIERIEVATHEALVIKNKEKITNESALERVKITSMFSKELVDLEIQSLDEINAVQVEQAEFEQNLRDKDLKAYEEYLKKKEEVLKEWRKGQEGDAKAQFELQKALLEEEIAAQERIIEDESASDEERAAAIEALSQKKSQLAIESARFEILTGKHTAQQLKTIYGLLQIELDKIRRAGDDKAKELSKEVIAREEKLGDEQEKRQKQNADNVLKNAELSKKLHEQELKDKMNGLQRWVQATMEAYRLINNLQNRRTERVLKNLEIEQDEVQNLEERERARAERTIKDEKLKEEAITKIEADADNKRKQIEDRRRQEQLAAARREKTLALISVVSNLIVGVSKEIASKGVAGLATSAAIGLYTTTLTSAIAALSIPAYEKGILKKPMDGPAIVGEGKKHNQFVPELVKPKDGKPFITSGPMLIPNLKKGSDVIPLPGIDPAAQYSIPNLPEVLNSLMLQSGGDMKVLEQLMQELIVVSKGKGNSGTKERTKDGHSHRSMERGHNRYNYLRKSVYE